MRVSGSEHGSEAPCATKGNASAGRSAFTAGPVVHSSQRLDVLEDRRYSPDGERDAEELHLSFIKTRAARYRMPPPSGKAVALVLALVAAAAYCTNGQCVAYRLPYAAGSGSLERLAQAILHDRSTRAKHQDRYLLKPSDRIDVCCSGCKHPGQLKGTHIGQTVMP